MRHSSYVEVNLKALARNVEKIQKLAPKAKLIPMVKGNAYGHGMIEIAKFLTHDLEISRLGVASLGEAVELLKHNKLLQQAGKTSKSVGLHRPAKRDVVVFSDTELTNPQHRRAYIEYGNAIVPVVASVEGLKVFLGCRELRQRPLHLKLNTGMNRLGLSLDELRDVAIPALRKAKISCVDHLVQHFAASRQVLRPQDRTMRQLSTFHEGVQILKDSGINVKHTSASNSGAIEQRCAVDETFVRPGFMMFGPPPNRLWTGSQVGHFYTQVISSSFAKCGTFVGYGFNPVEEDSVIAHLSIGYADGFLRYNTGLPIHIDGLTGHVHGTVNMDLTAVRFSLSQLGLNAEAIMKRVTPGKSVCVWDDNVHERAEYLKTSPYQLMSALSIRIPRVYLR